MLHHRKAPSTSLEEDFKTLGLGVDENSIHDQATMTIEEAVVGIGVHGHGESFTEDDDDAGGDLTEDEDGDDPLDGKFVTRELLARIVGLPLDQMEEEDYRSLLDELKQKELPEGDEELAALSEAVVEQLVEGMMQRIRKAAGGFARRAKAGFQNIAGKIKRIATGDRIKKARKRAKRQRGAGGVVSKRWRRTKGARNKKKLDNSKPVGMASDLAVELENLVSESVVGSSYSPVMERLSSIFSLIDEEFCDDAVCDVLKGTWDVFSKQITEDSDEESFLEAVKPCLIVIKRCLEEIEKQDLNHSDEDVSDDEDDDSEDEDQGNE